MDLKITRIDKELPPPKYETSGACGFDVAAREKTVIPPKSLGFISTGLVVQVPEGHTLILASRSSTPKRKGLLTPHGIGVIDQDFCGPEDELKIQVWNFTDEPVTVERGQRIAQCLLVPVAKVDFVEVEPDTSPARSRGGFGTTS